MKIDLTTLTKASVSGIVAGAAEFALLPVAVYVLHVERAIAFFAVQVIGTLITFALNRYWTFKARDYGQIHTQFARQMVMFGGSWFLNTSLPSLLTYRMHVEPVLAFAISQVVVYLAWNYPVMKHWVFRRDSELTLVGLTANQEPGDAE